MSEQPWTSHTITTNSVKMHYLRSGAGQPCRRISGWPELSSTYR
jgi:hypothetical protein